MQSDGEATDQKEFHLRVSEQGQMLATDEPFDLVNDRIGEKLDAGKKSVAYRFQYRAPDRTLKAEDVDEAHQKVLEELTKCVDAKFR